MSSFLKGLVIGATLFVGANFVLVSAHANSSGVTPTQLYEKCL